MSPANVLVSTLIKKLPVIRLYINSTASLAIGIAAQLLTVMVLARSLGTGEYGSLMSILAVTNLGIPWCAFGVGEAMRRRVGRDQSLYPTMLGHAVLVQFGWGSFLSAIIIAGMMFFTPVASTTNGGLGVLILMVPSSIVLFCWIGLTEQICLVFSEYSRANIINAGFGIARALTAIVACIGFGVHTLAGWAIWHAGVHILTAVACGVAIAPHGPPRLRLLREELSLGLTLGISGFFLALRQNIDILALSQVAAPSLVGTYAIARRMMATAFVVGASLDRLIYTKLAIAGQYGSRETFRLAQKYVVYAVALTGAASLALFVFAPLIPLVFGKGFEGAVAILRILCWSLIVTGVQNIAFDALNAAELHRYRLFVHVIAGALGVGLIVGLARLYGVNGTMLGVYLTESMIAIALWGTLTWLSRSVLRGEK